MNTGEYRYRGARALVTLHLRAFVRNWHLAVARGLPTAPMRLGHVLEDPRKWLLMLVERVDLPRFDAIRFPH